MSGRNTRKRSRQSKQLEAVDRDSRAVSHATRSVLTLPLELLSIILRQLDDTTLYSLALTNRSFHNLALPLYMRYVQPSCHSQKLSELSS